MLYLLEFFSVSEINFIIYLFIHIFNCIWKCVWCFLWSTAQ